MIKVYRDKCDELSYVKDGLVYPFFDKIINIKRFTSLDGYAPYNLEDLKSGFYAMFPIGLHQDVLVAEWSVETGLVYVEGQG